MKAVRMDTVKRDALVAHLQAHAARLSARVHDDMYREDPFWQERFGARGRRFADEDGQHHLHYLAGALEAGSPQPLVRYVRWLQSVLTSRGMCSRHIEDTFSRLAAALPQEGWTGLEREVAEAQDYLQRAAAGLVHADGPAAQLQAHAEAVVERVLAAPALQAAASRLAPAARERLAEEVRRYVSCLADATARGGEEPLASYLEWSTGHLQRLGLTAAEAHLPLDLLPEALELLPQAARGELVRWLGQARAASAAPAAAPKAGAV